MSKRNIHYIKPQDPSFLRKIKEQIGYKEGPTIEDKRQKLENIADNSDDTSDREDERPQVVVLKKGDLTEAEFDAAKKNIKQIEKEDNEKPADLNQRVVFRAKVKTTEELPSLNSEDRKSQKKSKKSKEQITKCKLSFSNEDEDDM